MEGVSNARHWGFCWSLVGIKNEFIFTFMNATNFWGRRFSSSKALGCWLQLMLGFFDWGRPGLGLLRDSQLQSPAKLQIWDQEIFFSLGQIGMDWGGAGRNLLCSVLWGLVFCKDFLAIF